MGGGRGDAWTRLLIEPYRNDRAEPEALALMFAALHALLGAGRALALEAHLSGRRSGAPLLWFAVVCPNGLEGQVEAALRRSYSDVRLRALGGAPARPAVAVRLRRLDPPRPDDEPSDLAVAASGALPRAMAAAGAPAMVRLVIRPASRLVELALSSGTRPSGPLFWAQPVVLAP